MRGYGSCSATRPPARAPGQKVHRALMIFHDLLTHEARLVDGLRSAILGECDQNTEDLGDNESVCNVLLAVTETFWTDRGTGEKRLDTATNKQIPYRSLVRVQAFGH